MYIGNCVRGVEGSKGCAAGCGRNQLRTCILLSVAVSKGCSYTLEQHGGLVFVQGRFVKVAWANEAANQETNTLLLWKKSVRYGGVMFKFAMRSPCCSPRADSNLREAWENMLL
jgi:hypothetical protein